MTRLRDPRSIYLAIGVAQGLFFGAWVLAAVVWWVVELGLSPIRLVLLGTALELAVSLAESPTGVVADVFSRKWSIVLSWLIIGVAQILAPIWPLFPVLLVWQALWGLGWTFQSGADTAWVTDETGRHDENLIVGRALAMSVGLVVGIAGSMALTRWSLPGTMIVAGTASTAFGLVLAVVMPERNFTAIDRSDRPTVRAIVDTWRQGFDIVRSSRVLRVVVAATFVVSMVDELVDRLDFARMRELGFPDLDGADSAFLFGAVWIGMTLLTIPVLVLVHRRSGPESDQRSARLMTGLLLGLAVGVGLMAGNVFVLAVYGWVQRDVIREVLEPVGEAWVNRHAPSEVRATVISFRSQSMAFGEIAGGLALGTVAELVSLQAGFAGGALLVLVAGSMIGRLSTSPVLSPTGR